MTDPSPWVSPAGAPAEPTSTPFTAPAGPPVAPPPTVCRRSPVGGPPQSPYGPPPGTWSPPPGVPVAPGAPQGWTPPPKPGLIPLRPLTLGPLLGASFQVMRRNPKPTFGLSLLLSGGVSVLALLISGLIVVVALQRVANAAPGDQAQIASGAVGIAFISLLIPLGVGLAASAILQGIISLEVARGTLGEKLRLRGLFRLARGRIGVLVGWALLLLAAATAGILLVVLVTVVLGVAFGANGLIAGGVIAFLLGAGLVVLAVWLYFKTSLVPSILMMERLALRAAIGRSWQLTNGYFWRTLGIQLLVSVIVSTATSIVTQPIAFIGGLVIGLGNPLDDLEACVTGTIVIYAATLIVSLIASSIGLIVQSSAVALIYIDLRMRKEGLDVELVRYVEARQAGDTSVTDPYLIRGGEHAPRPPARPGRDAAPLRRCRWSPTSRRARTG